MISRKALSGSEKNVGRSRGRRLYTLKISMMTRNASTSQMDDQPRPLLGKPNNLGLGVGWD
jgi:hypothetical protein